MSSPLSVFVAHSGKTVELAVGPQARVEAVQQTLADLTGIGQGDQILMCEGARLEGARQLSAYGLPWAGEGKVPDVFLYSRAHLRADAPLPPPEALPECPLDLNGLEGIRSARHRLDSAGSPLLRALPDYQRQFQEHLLQATARHEASQQRMATCARLVSEQEVQALSIDAATGNVEAHYAYICDAFQAFMQRYAQQAAAHADVLARFESDLRYLASVELHPALRSSASSSLTGSGGGGAGGGAAASGAASAAASAASAASSTASAAGASSLGGAPTLLQLVDAPALREAAAAASRGHAHFSGKVAELEGLFGALKAELEALFMQAPSVDLEALTRQLEEMHSQVDDQASIVAALSSDLGKVAQLVEQAGEALASDPAASVQVSDAVHMLETMHETHVAHLLPRVSACHEAVEAFAASCLACKNALTRDVFSQLRTISSQQSKIREMKNRLALFREALARQEASVQELLVVRRVPAAYKQCLAECVRRDAFMEKYAHSAAQLAERMGAFREKELAMRDAFRKHVERLIPGQLLERMGLLEQPPHCQVSVSAAEGERLLPVTVDDVRRIQLPWSTTSLLPPAQPAAAASPTAVAALAAAPAAAAAGAGPSARARGSREASAEPRQAQQAQQASEAQAVEVDITASLQLENAKLRAELASQIALDCIRTAQLAVVSGSLAGLAATPQQQQQQQPASGGASGQTSPQLAQSLAASSTQASTSAAAAGAAGALPPDAAQRFERALAAKEGLVAELQAQLGGARQQAASYEARIQQLEAQLGSMAAAADGRSPEPLLAGSGLLAARAAAEGEAVAPAVPAAGPAPALAAADPAGTATSHPLQLGGTAGPSSSASGSHGVTLPASPSAQQAGAAAAMEAALSASVDAATGSSLAGCLHSADSASRSLGPSSSLDPPARQAQRAQQVATLQPQQAEQQQPQQGQQPAEQPDAGQPEAAAAEPAASAADSQAAEQPAAAVAVSHHPAPSHVSDPPAELAQLETAVAPQPPPSEVAAEAGTAAPQPPQQPDTSGGAAALAASQAQLPAAQLLASVVVDEGSDVEGIEPVSDSEYESGEEHPAAGEHLHQGHPAAGEHLHQGHPAGDHPAAGEQEQPPADAVAAAAEHEQQQQHEQQQAEGAADAGAHPLAQ